MFGNRLSEQTKQMGYYASALLLVKGSAFLMLPVMTAYLSPSELGLLELLGIAAVFLCLLSGFAMHENLYRFIATEKSVKKQLERVSELYTLSLCLSAVVSILLTSSIWLFGSSLFTTTQIVFLSLAAMFETPMAIALAWIRLHDRARLFFKLSLITTSIQVSLVMAVLMYGASVTTVFAVNTAIAFAQFQFLHHLLGFSLALPTVTRGLGYIKYSSPIMMSALIAFGLSGAERWVISLIEELSHVGYYAVAAKFALGLGILIQPFHMWWMPKRFSLLEEQGEGTVVEKTLFGIAILCVLAIATAGLGQITVLWLLPDQYHISAEYLWIAIIAMLFKELGELFNTGVLYKQKSSWLLYINLFATISAGFVCWLNSSAGIHAVLWALAAGQAIRATMIYFVSQGCVSLPYPLAKVVLTVTITILMIYCSSLLTSFWLIPTVTLFQCSFVVLLCYILGIYKFNVSNQPVATLSKQLKGG